jgi:hypothetical protein
MPILMQDTYWDRSDAASAYEDTKLSAIALMEMLDRKLTRLACRMNDPFADERFREWIRDGKENVLAIIFLVSDIIGDEPDPVNMYVVADFFRAPSVIDGLKYARLSVLESNVTDFNMLMQEGSDSECSAVRALFSGELLVGGRNTQELDNAIGFAKELQKIFENEKLADDLGFLISLDVARGMQKNQGIDSGITNEDFKANAMRLMKKRRIEPSIQKKLLPAVKKALTVG